MSSNRKGFKDIRTIRSQVDRFRARTPQGALIELARLSQKKARLSDEMKRWQERINQIQSELEEIDKTEKWLYQSIDNRQLPSTVPLQGKKSSPPLPPGFHEMNIRY